MAGNEITFCGVNAHFQNGIAERSICTIVDQARMMLLHAIEKWLDEITIDLWPCTLRLAVDIYNSTPTESGLSPEEIFMSRRERTIVGPLSHIWLSHLHTGTKTPTRTEDSKVGTKVLDGTIPWALPFPCPNCPPHPESTVWTGITPIPCHL